jgi:hypothetical protein
LAVGAVVASLAALGLGLRWWGDRRAHPPTVVRCPIHGIAYDANLELCPDCAKTDRAGGSGTLPSNQRGGAR